MKYRALACLLLGAMAWAQTDKPATPAPKTAVPATAAPVTSPVAKSSAPSVATAPDAVVITVQGVCSPAKGVKVAPANCKTVVTRAEFERLVNAIQPAMVPFARKQFATRYAMGLVMANKAHQMGLDQGQKFNDLMKLARMQVLAQEMGKSLQEKAAKVSDKEIEDYYKNNAPAYEETALQRIFIPKAKQPDTSSKEKPSEEEAKKQQEASQAEMKKVAEDLRTRAAAGEDFAKLQDEAFKGAGITAKVPNSSMGKMRRVNLPPTHAGALDLKSGEVSELITDQSGYFIYKAGEKDTVPIEKVKEEIHSQIQGQKMQDAMQAMQASTTPKFDEKYFAVPAGAGPQGVNLAAPPAPKAAQPETK